MKKLMILGIVLLLASFVHAGRIACDFEEITGDSGYIFPNFTLNQNDEIFCNTTTLLLRQGANYITDFIIEGELTIINSTIKTPYQLHTNFIIKDGGNLHINNTDFISDETPPSTGKIEGTHSIFAEENSNIEIINVSFYNATYFKMEQDFLFLDNIFLDNAPLNLHNVFRGYINNVTSNKELFLNDTTLIEIKGSRFLISNSSYIIQSNEIIISNTTFLRDNNSRLKIEDSTLEINNITFIDDPLNFVTNITLEDKSYIVFVDTNTSAVNIIDDESYFDQYFTLYYNITNLRTGKPVSRYLAESFNRTKDSFISKESDIKGEIALPLIAFTRNLTNIKYYSNYTTIFTRENYETFNHSWNVTESKKFNLTMKTTKGIIAECDIGSDEIPFCAEKNPLFSQTKFPNGMTKGDRLDITFLVNATGNGFDIKGKAFPFFIIVESDLDEVETQESSAINITVVESN